MIGTNAFGLPKYSPRSIFDDKKVFSTLEFLLSDWLNYLNVDGDHEKIISATMNSLGNFSAQTGLIDENLRQDYVNWGIIDKIKQGLMGRASDIYDLIVPFLGKSILDMGCGPGEIAQHIKDHGDVNICLADIVDVDKRREFAPNLPFSLRTPGSRLPYSDGSFDTGLLITVLHHADNPIFELEETARVTNGNLIIVESIYGVNKEESPLSGKTRFPGLYKRFHALNEEQQRMYGTFLDWFLNKMILGNEINCPYNFNSNANWENLFKQKNFSLIHKKMLGIDQPVTPEYHVLYVVSTRKS